MTKVQKRLQPEALIGNPVAPEHQPVQVLCKDGRTYLLYLDELSREHVKGRNLRGQKLVLDTALVAEIIIEKTAS